MGMLPVRIDERHVVRVKDPATSEAGVHYWLALHEATSDERVAEKPCLAAGECILPWDLLRPDDEDYDVEPLERAMARGFAAAILNAD